ncbi:MAG TPA: S-layer homology domain-containing protein [Candidatus Flavonifractor merdigallinarum]|uniref:S-layer homology domain-containing protein n=1 Tax=Candidatus Flavonifractor merdigallinarum TaxID=2838589 RepID=A0A9D2BZW9_9FIRM|nr:S-layer homology domain-containing protein [Candidatus Flavonifractor merdigallinarum]
MNKQVWNWVLGSALSLALLSGIPAASAQGQSDLDAAEALYCLGLLDGSGTQTDGTPNFNLSGQMTRGEAITMVVRLTGGKTEAEARQYRHPFSDVADWGAPYVGYAYAYGITSGIGDGVFGFQREITQAEYLTMLLRAIGYVEVDWRDPYSTAAQVGLVEGVDYTRAVPFLRGDMALLSRNILDVPVAGESYTLYEALDAVGALEQRELPTPTVSITPGPSTTVSNQIRVTSGDDLFTQFAAQIDARNSTVTVYTPIGEERNYSSVLLSSDGISRFPDVDTLRATSYPNQGYFVVEIQYRDAARVMAYLEGKSSTLSAHDQTLYQEAKRVHDSLVTAGMSEYQRVKAFHDYLCSTVTYQDYGSESHTAYGALVNHAAVCQGYTQAMDLLCYLSGIDCEHIFGSSRGQTHSWVRVKIEGQWYNVDTTWDDQTSGIHYDYFLVSDRTLSADHTWKAYPNWPTCPVDYAA